MTAYGDTVGETFRNYTLLQQMKEEARRRSEEKVQKSNDDANKKRDDEKKDKERNRREDEKEKAFNERQDNINNLLRSDRQAAEKTRASEFEILRNERAASAQNAQEQFNLQMEKQQIAQEEANYRDVDSRAFDLRNKISEYSLKVPEYQAIIEKYKGAFPEDEAATHTKEQKAARGAFTKANTQLETIRNNISQGHSSLASLARQRGYVYDPNTFSVIRPQRGYGFEGLQGGGDMAPTSQGDVDAISGILQQQQMRRGVVAPPAEDPNAGWETPYDQMPAGTPSVSALPEASLPVRRTPAYEPQPAPVFDYDPFVPGMTQPEATVQQRRMQAKQEIITQLKRGLLTPSQAQVQLRVIEQRFR